MWPHAFRATLTVTVGGPHLKVEFSIQNTGTTSFHFTGALHTYLGVRDIAATVVENLGGCHYRESAKGIQDVIQVDPELSFTDEVDRIYMRAPGQVAMREPGRRMVVKSFGFPDVVVWNPGPEKCAALGDMDPEGYRRMLCIEAPVISEPPEVLAGESWYGSQELTAQ